MKTGGQREGNGLDRQENANTEEQNPKNHKNILSKERI